MMMTLSVARGRADLRPGQPLVEDVALDHRSPQRPQRHGDAGRIRTSLRRLAPRAIIAAGRSGVQAYAGELRQPPAGKAAGTLSRPAPLAMRPRSSVELPRRASTAGVDAARASISRCDQRSRSSATRMPVSRRYVELDERRKLERLWQAGHGRSTEWPARQPMSMTPRIDRSAAPQLRPPQAAGARRALCGNQRRAGGAPVRRARRGDRCRPARARRPLRPAPDRLQGAQGDPGARGAGRRARRCRTRPSAKPTAESPRSSP